MGHDVKQKSDIGDIQSIMLKDGVMYGGLSR
jgi:hypothetical protein